MDIFIEYDEPNFKIRIQNWVWKFLDNVKFQENTGLSKTSKTIFVFTVGIILIHILKFQQSAPSYIKFEHMYIIFSVGQTYDKQKN